MNLVSASFSRNEVHLYAGKGLLLHALQKAVFGVVIALNLF